LVAWLHHPYFPLRAVCGTGFPQGHGDSFSFHGYSWGLLPLVVRRWGLKSIPNTFASYPGFPRPAGRGTPGDRWGATAVRGLGETVEKETVGKQTQPAVSGETVSLDVFLYLVITHGLYSGISPLP